MDLGIINLISGTFLLTLGFCIKKFNMSYLISGYNTASKKEKEKYNEKNLVKYIGNMIILSSGIIYFGMFLSLIFVNHKENINIITWILFTIFIIGGTIYSNITSYVKK